MSQDLTLYWRARRAIANSVRAVAGDRVAEKIAPILRPMIGAGALEESGAAASGFVAVLSYDPPIFMTSTVNARFLGIAPAFGMKYGPLPATFLIYPTKTIETEGRSAHMIASVIDHRTKYPQHALVFLCSTAAEKECLAAAGLTAHLLNHNFAVSDLVYRPLPNVEVEFDAIYNANFRYIKRHELAAGIKKVAYLAYDLGTKDERKRLRRILAHRPEHVLINPVADGAPIRLSSDEVNVALNRAAVGLCLSKVEGANYASMEYMLAGLPIVSTPSMGGRDVYFDHEFCTICDPNPLAVREAVEALKARKIPRDYIRKRTLAKIEPDRRRFLTLVDDLTEALGGKRYHGDRLWPSGFPDKIVSWQRYEECLHDFENARA